MPQRAIGIVVAVTGLLFVICLILMRYDIRRAARTGPRWKRNLVLAGIFVLTSLGLVSGASSVSCTPTGRLPALGVMETEISMRRLSERLALLEGFAAADRLEPEVVEEVLAMVEQDMTILEKGEYVGGLSEAERVRAVELREKVKVHVKKIREKLKGEETGTADSKGTPAASTRSLTEAKEWRHLSKVWKEAQEKAFGKRGGYPFDRRGKERILGELDLVKKDIAALAETGLINVVEAELLARDLAVLVRGIDAKRTTEQRNVTCYKPAPFMPARESFKRLSVRMPLLEKLARTRKLQRNVVEKIAANIERDIANLEKEENLDRMPFAERDKALEVREKAKTLLRRLRRGRRPRQMCYRPREMCYMPIERPPRGRGSSDINRQLELMKRMVYKGKVKPVVLEKALQSVEDDLGKLSGETHQEKQALAALSEIKHLLGEKM